MFSYLLLFLSLAGACGFSNTFAWDQHPQIAQPTVQKLSASAAKMLDTPIVAPCPEEDAKTYAELARELGLNPSAHLVPTAQDACKSHTPITGRQILIGHFTADPDDGIDVDLPDSEDPQNFRPWMGGKRGGNSQGFRHMYFGGWKILHPLNSFQIPPRPIGYAPERAQKMALRAREFFKQGKPAWGFRLLAWSMHYLQDLAQPFHAAQIPSLKLVPWFALYDWPPSLAFERLVSETTRVIGNEHYAYEAYVTDRLAVEDLTAPFLECMEQAKRFSNLNYDPAQSNIFGLAHKIAEASRGLAPKLGRAEAEFFGDQLKMPGVDIPAGHGAPRYSDWAIRPELMQPRLELHQTTCTALANAVRGGQFLLEWAFHEALPI